MGLTQKLALPAPLAANPVQVFRPREISNLRREELRKQWHHGVRVDAHAVGWLPTKVCDMRLSSNDFAAVYNNGDLVGWCMHAVSERRRVMKLYQIWVRPDARLILHGRALIAETEAAARRHTCWLQEAWVAEDLPANAFWQAMGFTTTNWRWGKGKNPRRILRWVRNVF